VICTSGGDELIGSEETAAEEKEDTTKSSIEHELPSNDDYLL
jgi:hypothetical protein